MTSETQSDPRCEPMTHERRIEGLRNLREGYSLTAAVGFWQELHAEDLIEVYAAVVEQFGAYIKERDARDQLWGARPQ